MSGWGRIAAPALLAALAIAACGDGKTFTAQEFVDRVNDEGVGLMLGEPLLTDEPEQELFAVELEPVAQLPGSGEDGGASGSLSVSEGDGGAEREMTSCEAAADLLCYRAGNVVIVLEGGGIEAQQLGVAVERVAAD